MDKDFVYGSIIWGIVIIVVIIGVGALTTFVEIEGDKREIEFAALCQKDGKQVQFRETNTAVYSECK